MKKTKLYITITLLLFTSLGAFYGGFFLMMDPSGKLLHLHTYPLLNSPFIDYFFPGLILFVANGVLALTAAIATWKQTTLGYYLVFLQGLTLLGWIAVQVSMLQVFNPWQLCMAVIGVTLTVLGGSTIVRRNLTTEQALDQSARR